MTRAMPLLLWQSKVESLVSSFQPFYCGFQNPAIHSNLCENRAYWFGECKLQNNDDRATK
jgi:hypothetical protein